MSYPLYQVDAFTDTPYAGNPAAVVICEPGAGETLMVSDSWFQRVAAEMNLSETAFLVPRGDVCSIVWFTPPTEVDLCGHATLASAHALWSSGVCDTTKPITFRTRRCGDLIARPAGAWIELDFPLDAPKAAAFPAGIEDALGVRPLLAAKGRDDMLFELADEAAVRELRPNLAAIARLECRGVIVTAESGADDVDFVSRFFAPQSGIAEDPVTGSAHCTLGPWWSKRLMRDELVGRQVSKRGGTVRVRVDAEHERAILAGRAVTVMRGELLC